MKKKTGVIAGIIGAILIAGIIVWQFVKKDVVKNAVENAVSKGSDNDYYIKYDSSFIDEIGGNAAFFNIVLQSDSMQKKLLESDTSIDPTIYNVRVQALTISGANIPAFLQKSSIQATKIQIVKPVITIISTGKEEHKMTREDTLALYKKLTGKFNSIKAGEIEIVDAVIAFANGNKSPHTTLQDVNLVLKNLVIDKDHNYDDIVSYFVKDIVVTAKSATTINEKKNEVFVAEGIKYSAPGKNIEIEKVLQKNSITDKSTFDLQGISLEGINTNQFVYANKIEADRLTIASGKATIYQKQNSTNKKTSLEVDNDFFNRAQIKNLNLGPVDLTIVRPKAGQDPLLLKNLQFTATGLGTVTDGTNLQNIIAKSNWQLSMDGFTLPTDDGVYDIELRAVRANSGEKTFSINSFTLNPKITWTEYTKRLKSQKDYYIISAKNLKASQVDLGRLVNDQEFIAGDMSLNLDLRTFNDRLLPYDKSSKVGKYPNQQLMDLDVPVNIRKLKLSNSSVIYRERGRISAKTGDVSFTNINATITNVTNIPALIKNDNQMVVSASAKFMNASNVKTTWVLPLAKANSTFKVSGSLTGFDASVLNKISEPLGMASFTKGNINGVSFSMTGNDYHTDGNAILKYNNLKVKLLKSEGDSTAKLDDKDLVSFAANLLIKNSNPTNGNLRSGEINFDRDITKSFFNLLWKSIFQAGKRIARGKNDE